MTSVCSTFISEYDYIGIWHASGCAESKDVRNGYTLYILADLGALTFSKYCTFLLCLHTFVKYDECMQHFHEWVWLDRDLTRIWMCRIERCTQWLHSVHSCCAFALMLSKYCTLYWCLHTFVKYDECMQHFHEWVWLDRDLTRIWMCRIERCTQWLHSVHSCCAWCSDVVK